MTVSVAMARWDLAAAGRTPRIGDFGFFGFDDLMPQIARLIDHMEIRSGEPAVTIADGGVYVPKRQAVHSHHQREELAGDLTRETTAEPVRELDEEVVYLGWLFNHYGHFLMQSLARVWYLREVAPSVRVLFHYPGRSGWEPARWALRMLAEFGIPQERILTLDEPTRLRRLIVPEPLFEPRSVTAGRVVRAHVAMARPYREVAERIASSATPTAQPVYLSRRLLPSRQRLMVGEAELEATLRHNGFHIAHLQTMPFAEQVRLVNSHEHIVSNAGSAAQNVLFALHRPRLHLLTNAQFFSPDYFMHAMVSGTETSFINCLGTGGRERYPGNQKLTPHLLDAESLLAYLARVGLLEKGVPPSPAANGARLRVAYDEAWLYGRIQALLSDGEAIPEEIEREARQAAATSWPLSLSLAQHHASRDAGQATHFARQFVALVQMERDAERLARYRADAEDLALIAKKRLGGETAKSVAAVVASRFQVSFDAVANG